MLSRHKLIIVTALFTLSIQEIMADKLDDFSSDGCSQFPDGTLSQQDLWCDCCITHDIAYWQGGSRKQKKQADKELRQCILNKTNNTLLANTMYFGVTIGGLPIFPTWYRWGYGWRYGRGFKSLNLFEKQQAEENLARYFMTATPNSCDFEHPVKLIIKKEIRQFLGNEE